MSQANYKSVRLLVERIHAEMTNLRKFLMVNGASEMNDAAQETWVDLRKLLDELSAKASRVALEDVAEMSPADYVGTMKPLVANYHRQLMTGNALVPCLCEDLQALACVVVLIGEGKTVVRTAHVPDRPEVAVAVEAILAAIDGGTKRVAEEGAAALEAMRAASPEDPETT